MNIRGKIVVVVLPLIVTPLLFSGLIATLLARNGITGVATRFLQFKAEQIVTYANGQWGLLVDNELADRQEFRDAAAGAVASFAAGVIRSPTELIFAVGRDGALAFSTDADVAPGMTDGIPVELGWSRMEVADEVRVGYVLPFEPFEWLVYVTEEESTFYASTFAIIRQVGLVLAVAVAVALVLLVVFAGYLTRPLRAVASAMERISATGELSERVDVLYSDETGRLAHTFNQMTDQLEQAYSQIKTYALRAAMARIKEQKTRTMFQKFVPNEVIEQYFANPESMLVGEDRFVSILFSDIRSFTTLSEMMRPDVVVDCLNRYFAVMVDTIMSRHGIVDKFMGDAIMALFGTPERREDAVQQSVYAGLDMLDALADFNRWQLERQLPGFRIGIGINYGTVTVGNIGSEKKLEYTVIGDMVNVASRLEGLTKRYDTPLVVSASVYRKIEGELPTRLLDTVHVKGRKLGFRVYGVARSLEPNLSGAWQSHNEAMELYYAQDFEAARARFRTIRDAFPADVPARLMLERCEQLMRSPPGTGWTGSVEMAEK